MRESTPQLMVVFAPGLWPFRSQLDGVVWLLTQCAAAGLTQVEGLTAYATPRALVEPEPAVKLLRSLPPDALVLDECAALGATWAVTGRVLEDSKGLELWLNLVDGASGTLLWTTRETSSRGRFVWRFTAVVRRLVRHLQKPLPVALEAKLVAPSTSFPALVAWTRARARHAVWQGEREAAFDIVRDAARAAAHDHEFIDAIELMVEVAEGLLGELTDPLDLRRLRESIVADSSLEPARRLRQAAHERLLALAKHPSQT